MRSLPSSTLMLAVGLLATALTVTCADPPANPADCSNPAKLPAWVPADAKWCHRCVTMPDEAKCGDTANGRCQLRNEYEQCAPKDGEDPQVAACFSCPDDTALPKKVCLFTFTDAACKKKADTTPTPCNKDDKPGKIGNCAKEGDKCICKDM